jgi:hypothetical protein
MRIQERSQIAEPSLGYFNAIVHENDVGIPAQLNALVDAGAPAPIFPIPDDRYVARVDLVQVGGFIRGCVVDDIDVKRYIRKTVNSFEQVSREGIPVAYGNDDVCSSV